MPRYRSSGARSVPSECPSEERLEQEFSATCQR
uniref:Uncharacterized protein n=1 Tax=Arundo donax TaxID=35708 RepID=A0A0A9FJP4_ARUDO